MDGDSDTSSNASPRGSLGGLSPISRGSGRGDDHSAMSPLSGKHSAQRHSLSSSPTIQEIDVNSSREMWESDGNTDADAANADGAAGGIRIEPGQHLSASSPRKVDTPTRKLWMALKRPSPKKGQGAHPGKYSDHIRVQTSHRSSELPGHVRTSTNSRSQRPKLDQLVFTQCLCGVHKGKITCLAASRENMFFASGGEDGLVVLWRVLQAKKEEIQQGEQQRKCDACDRYPVGPRLLDSPPHIILSGHRKAITDLAWSDTQFLLSASADHTVRLWHVQVQKKCLYVFVHSAPVTCVDFFPDSDSRFISGSETTVRVWNIADGKIETSHIIESGDHEGDEITALCSIAQHETYIIVGQKSGRVAILVYQSNKKKDERLEHHNYIERRSAKKAKRVTGIAPFICTNPTTSRVQYYIVVSTNDSRVRLYTLETFACIYKFSGLENSSEMIKPSLLGNYIISGSEDKQVYVWEISSALEQDSGAQMMLAQSKKIMGVIRKKSNPFETFPAYMNGAVTCTLFAGPRTAVAARGLKEQDLATGELQNAIILTAGVDGHIHVFENITS